MKTDLSNFYVITVISNPIRFRSRYELYKKFEEMVACSGAKLITVEQAFGERPFVVTQASNPNHVQLRSIDELWSKEIMLNIGIQYLMQIDPNAKYVAWVDADVSPNRLPREWFEETWHALQHYQIVQMFEWAQDLCPNYNPHGNKHMGFMAAYVKSGYKKPTRDGVWDVDYYSHFGHPGYAWAANISALTALGQLIDFAVLGAGDRHMALGLVGAIDQSIPVGMTENYSKMLMEWQIRCDRYIKRDVGFVAGGITHSWHGKKKDRRYHDRWKILLDNAFDPISDLKRDAQGLYQLESHTERQLMLRDQIRSYFRARNEDSIDL